MNVVLRVLIDEEGAALVEYALVAGLVSAGAIVVLAALGAVLSSTLNVTSNNMTQIGTLAP